MSKFKVFVLFLKHWKKKASEVAEVDGLADRTVFVCCLFTLSASQMTFLPRTGKSAPLLSFPLTFAVFSNVY